MDERSFQDVFKELRLEKNLSQDKIASELDVSQSLINNWETGRSTPAPEMLEYIADYFNVSVDYLIGRSKYKNLEAGNNELDNILFSKAKDLSDEDKKAVLGIINALKKDIDKELDK
ncbi:MAG TPA: helix-turn-helix transcriptional regulator [Candidatus Aphodocola excrementigallinarum]|uniref:Helix-turn-helix transcriptional regulator n=1 Tax=Candidatus Aphodocola excrementigallinarum TaxID=2840670 RepID=A0A9D1LHC6_9FIRM|nr:helix-turn-helix transcriptional regulator [Candidatus Aphodocola excrementigallinarum]